MDAPQAYPEDLLKHILVIFPSQIPPTLDEADLMAAYRFQARLWHPDKVPKGSEPAVGLEWDAKMKSINLAKEALLEAIKRPTWTHGRPPPDPEPGGRGGQRGRRNEGEPKAYTLRVKRFEGTISGLLQGELTPRSVELQLLERAQKMNRGIRQMVIGLELHKIPKHPMHDHHIHFVIEFSVRLYHNSSELLLLLLAEIVAGNFDLTGASGATLRTHITHVETDLDWDNKCRCLAL